VPIPATIADSVRDEEMLDRLREVTPAADDGPTPEVGFDINVARYAEHGRVKFYLDFFRSTARERMTVWLNRKPIYEPMIRSALAANSLPEDLVYLALIESGYSNTAVSRSRAVGMWQFMKGTAKEYGLRVDQWVDERRDPVKATHAAARYLSDLTTRFGGSHYLAAAAYNGGGGRVSRGLRKLGAGAEEAYYDEEEVEQELADDPNGDDRFFHLSDSRYLRRETKDYVPKLIAAAIIGKQPDKYGFPTVPPIAAYAVDSVPVTEPTSLEVIAKAGGLPVETVAGLNPYYIRGVTPPTALAWVRVPVGAGVATTEALAAVPSSDRITSFTHVVARRETIRSIARRYGLTPTDLAHFNQIAATAKLTVGSLLRVPGKVKLTRFATSDREAAAGGKAGGVHRVRQGETLGSIARRYRVSLNQLLAWNDIGPKSTLRIGQRIKLGPSAESPGRAPQAQAGTGTHVVRRGETLGSLARRYRVSVAALMSANGIRSARDLRAGQRLTIPS
jgi:membrane-bound lytic murein transglycosylase D